MTLPDSDFKRAQALVETLREEGAAMERAKCAAEHITRAQARAWIVKACLGSFNSDPVHPLDEAERYADLLMAQGEKAETGEKA